MRKEDLLPTIAARGFEQCYRDSGEGVAIVALHAFPLDGAMWRFQSEALGGSARWIVPDLRGFGASAVAEETLDADGLPAPRTPATFADDVAELLDRLRVERAILCGTSMGGYVAFEFARRHRARLAGLILCDTRADADSPAKRADRRKMAEEVMQRGSDATAEAFSPKLLSKATRELFPEKANEIVATIRRQPATAIAATSLGLGERADMTDLLPSFRVPTLVLCGAEDLLTPVDVMREMADAMPDSRFVVIRDAGHLAPFERPESVNAEIVGFLNDRFDVPVPSSAASEGRS